MAADAKNISLNFVTGTAAELIKIYPVIAMAVARGYGVRVVSTGQSRENFLMQYRDLRLDESLLSAMMTSEGDLGQASSALKWFFRALFVSPGKFRSSLLVREKTFVVVHGDTLSTLVGSLLARRAGFPIVHVEAGLRSPSLLNPFPEEINRRWVSKLATYHMAPDTTAEMNLKRARVKGKVVVTRGNTLLDAVTMVDGVNANRTSAYALVNIHRFENLNSSSRWSVILDTVARAAEKTKVIFVMHPQTRHKLDNDAAALAKLTHPNIELRDRMPFSEFIGLLKRADYLISDGGSNQEECSYLGKPCLILRERTERTEGLDTCCLLTRFDQKLIDGFLANPSKYAAPALANSESPTQVILNSL
ncbi:MAG: UDP-N-acetylglucosamine 2-epimerase [Bdellovibrionota bacterium]